MREEHTLGNHSWSHPNFTKLTTSQAKEEVLSTEEEIISLTGNNPTLFRPPYGECTEADFQMINELGTS
ncbi:TPA: polysaccharide deacetylase family protein [Bacillus anthracis]|uniref:Polysaccharide deacetylase family protein n=1 Tax=Bacillus anthracis TaxID=1392 RepID=A0A2B0WTW2_BACAN|nr:polysaccharide deacetylase family protein [Bacillus cereus]PFL55300.1 polysaccharide deacetylase family protein [Bacillus anthracis]HDR7438086.1 polysaccharide deacetylase family protein [Bacillus anthracis]